MDKKGIKKKRTAILVWAFVIVVLGAALFVVLSYFNLAHKIELLSYTRITTPDELMAIKDDPSGEYVLVKDIDMSGTPWVPVTFNGVLDGNGHSISNLKITTEGTTERTTYDGNMKEYATVFSGVFDILEDGKVCDIIFENGFSTQSLHVPLDKATQRSCAVSGIVAVFHHIILCGIRKRNGNFRRSHPFV